MSEVTVRSDRMRMRQGKRGRVKMKEVEGRGRARRPEMKAVSETEIIHKGTGKLIRDTKERIRWRRREGWK